MAQSLPHWAWYLEIFTKGISKRLGLSVGICTPPGRAAPPVKKITQKIEFKTTSLNRCGFKSYTSYKFNLKIVDFLEFVLISLELALDSLFLQLLQGVLGISAPFELSYKIKQKFGEGPEGVAVQGFSPISHGTSPEGDERRTYRDRYSNVNSKRLLYSSAINSNKTY